MYCTDGCDTDTISPLLILTLIPILNTVTNTAIVTETTILTVADLNTVINTEADIVDRYYYRY